MERPASSTDLTRTALVVNDASSSSDPPSAAAPPLSSRASKRPSPSSLEVDPVLPPPPCRASPPRHSNVAKAEAALRRLDAEYASLDLSESVLFEALSRLKEEEVSLRRALDHASETLKERRVRERREREKEAERRLEIALLGEDDDDSDSDNSDDGKSSINGD